MQEDYGVKVMDFKPNQIGFDTSSCDYYAEVKIINTLGEDLYLAEADGSCTTIPTLSISHNLVPEVKIQIGHRCGRADPSRRGFEDTPTFAKKNLNGKIITINLERLRAAPLFVPELGKAIAIQSHITELSKVNCLSNKYKETVRDEILTEFLQGNAVPSVIYGNVHQDTLTHLFVEINDKLMSVVLSHRKEEPEQLKLMTNRGGIYETVNISVDWSNPSKHSCFTHAVGNRIWILGTDRAKVQEAITKKVEEERSRMTYAEVQALIQQESAKLRKALEEKELQLTQTLRELELVKKDLSSTKIELDRANSSAHASYEQQVLAAKIAAQQLEQENLRTKLRMQRENDLLNQQRDYAKFGYEQKINETKVQKEELSVRSAEASTFATVMKTVAVIAPIVISGVIWLTTRSASSSITGLLGVTSMFTSGVTTTVGCAGSLLSGVTSVIRDTTNTISNAIDKIGSWLRSFW